MAIPLEELANILSLFSFLFFWPGGGGGKVAGIFFFFNLWRPLMMIAHYH